MYALGHQWIQEQNEGRMLDNRTLRMEDFAGLVGTFHMEDFRGARKPIKYQTKGLKSKKSLVRLWRDAMSLASEQAKRHTMPVLRPFIGY